MKRHAITITVLLCTLGCGSVAASRDAGATTDAGPIDAEPFTGRSVDILFVVDNSGSMADEQTALAISFQRFVDVLGNAPGGLPDVHIGVISSDVGVGGNAIAGCAGAGDSGSLQNVPRVPGCAPPSGRYIENIDDGQGGRTRNYSGTMSDTFSCIAKLGISGCGFEQHFESMKQALEGNNADNVGFLREDALLVVIVVGDEDDCSASDTGVFDATQTSINDPVGPLTSFRCAEFGVLCGGTTLSRSAASYSSCVGRGDSFLHPPQFYADFLKGLKANPNNVLVAVIAGNESPFDVSVNPNNGIPSLDPSCTSAAGSADPAVRMIDWMNQFGTNGIFSSICNTDLSGALTAIANRIASRF